MKTRISVLVTSALLGATAIVLAGGSWTTGQAPEPRSLDRGDAQAPINPDRAGMVRIPDGTFMMGCSQGESQCAENEKPPHRVTVSAFWMDATPVTQAQFRKVMEEGSSMSSACGDCPARSASWAKARAYCTKLGKRLPKEAEWEHAARGGGSESLRPEPGAVDLDRKRPVGQRQPNAYGVHDMLIYGGEWCADWYDFYSFSSTDTPEGANPGWSRVVHGHASASSRFGVAHSGGFAAFRCALDEAAGGTTQALPQAPSVSENEGSNLLSRCDASDGEACFQLATQNAPLDDGEPEPRLDAREYLYPVYLRRACDCGSAKGCRALGNLQSARIWREDADVSEKEFDNIKSDAVALYKKACDLGDMIGCTEYASGLAHDYEKTRYDEIWSLYWRSCQARVAFACTHVAFMLEHSKLPADRYVLCDGKTNASTDADIEFNGRKFTSLDAVAFLRKACEYDDSRGCLLLGNQYSDWEGDSYVETPFPVDVSAPGSTAEGFYQRACALGEADGCARCGRFAEKRRDYAGALRLYRKAAVMEPSEMDALGDYAADVARVSSILRDPEKYRREKEAWETAQAAQRRARAEAERAQQRALEMKGDYRRRACQLLCSRKQAMDAMLREKKAGLISGYVDERMIHDAGVAIIVLGEELSKLEAEYRSNVGEPLKVSESDCSCR